jgi:hypothetical protein
MGVFSRNGRTTVGLGLAAAALASGCATTHVSSHVSPDATARSYRKLMIFVKLKDLDLRQQAEHEFQDSLAGHGTQIVSSLDVLLPGQKRSKEESRKILADAGVDAVLVIHPAEEGTSETYIPETTTIHEHRGRVTEVTTGGYTEEGEHWAKYDAALHDRVSHKSSGSRKCRRRGFSTPSGRTS